MKKLLSLLLALTLILSLAACGSKEEPAPARGESAPASEPAADPAPQPAATPDETPAEPAPEPAPAEPAATGETYTVGICQLVTHVALDAATEGFQDALNEKLPGQVTFDYQNAANDPATWRRHGHRQFLRHRRRQHLRHLRPGPAGPAGRDD